MRLTIEIRAGDGEQFSPGIQQSLSGQAVPVLDGGDIRGEALITATVLSADKRTLTAEITLRGGQFDGRIEPPRNARVYGDPVA